jgi:hypothetical protein
MNRCTDMCPGPAIGVLIMSSRMENRLFFFIINIRDAEIDADMKSLTVRMRCL